MHVLLIANLAHLLPNAYNAILITFFLMDHVLVHLAYLANISRLLQANACFVLMDALNALQ